MSSTYKDGQAAASGDEPARVVYLRAEPTEKGLDLAAELRREPPDVRAWVRGRMARAGYKSLARLGADDVARAWPLMTQLIERGHRAMA